MSLPFGSTTAPAECEAEQDLDAGDLCLAISAEDGDWPQQASLEAAIRRVARAIARHPAATAVRGREATIVLGSDALLARLNGTYRRKPVPTNVLAFPFRARAAADQEGNRYLGDVLLAQETIAREAAERRLVPLHHLQHLVVHGVLHLIGYDHATEPEAVEMERLEVEILAALGLQDPYALSLSNEP
jgi:probable rRNA maturation factor